MKVTQEQLRAMVASSDPLFLSALKKLVQEEHAYVVDGLPDELFDEMLRNGVAAARSFGLTEPKAIATFVLLMFEFGPEFYRHPAIRKALTDALKTPEDRLKAVVESMPDQVWEEVQGTISKQHWFPDAR